MWAVASALILASCSKDEVVINRAGNDSAEVRFSVNQWDVSTEPMGTRATASECNMSDIWLFAYSDDTLAAQVHQASTDANFGSITMNLKFGKYYFYCVSSRGASPLVDTDAKTVSWGTVRDTFWALDSMEVSATTATNKKLNLARIAGRAVVQLTDVIPSGAQQLVFRPSHWYYGVNYQSGAAVGDSSSDINVNIPSSYIGQQGLKVTYMSISPKDGYTTDVDATLKGDGDTNLGSVHVADVPMGRNVSVTLTGAILNPTRSPSIDLQSDWVDGSTITW